MKKKYSFTHENRLKKEDFQKVFKNGQKYLDYMAIMYVLKKENMSTKFGISAGKKIGNAVVRNSIKRKMREVCRHLQHDIKKNYEIVWIARKPLQNASIELYCESFIRLCKKANLFDSRGVK